MCRLPHASSRILTLHLLNNPFSGMIEMKSRGDNLQCQCSGQRRLPHSSTPPNDTTRSPSTGEQCHLARESETSDTPPSFPPALHLTIECQFAGPRGGRVARCPKRTLIACSHARSGGLAATAPAPSNNAHAPSLKPKELAAQMVLRYVL